jgi:Protein kinase domain/WD40-like Beta Propeller Repeat
MTLGPGTRIGPYEVVSPIGAGGMGEVYRGRDSRLHRDVALKILPEIFASDPDRLARFEREARTLAAFNHPHIAGIYGVEESNGIRALALELVDGQTLADRIARGPLPADEALPVARQIAEALEAAHEHGILHRDLKPSNIIVRPDGAVKLLDFGLAKALDLHTGSDADAMNSPTIMVGATQNGIILGTAAYMSPEQARGRIVDRRSDIWAFGCVVYEMLTGVGSFTGATVSDTLASVIKSEPDFTKLPADTPPPVRELLRRCLVKDPLKRLQAIGDARIVLEEILDGTLLAEPIRPRDGSPRPALAFGAAAGALALITMVTWMISWRSRAPAARPPIRLNVDLGPDALPGQNTAVAIAPDGSRLVFPARGANGVQQLATRRLDRAEATLIAGTANAVDPFFSPDGMEIGFFAGGKLKKVSLEGGAPVTLCDASNARGAAWGEDGNIILMPWAGATGLWRIHQNGGPLQVLTKPAEKGQATHRWPQILPGSQAVLFSAGRSLGNYETGSIEVLSLKTGEWKEVVHPGYFGRYVPGGYLLFIRQRTLYGVRFDLDHLEVRGAPVPLLEDVAGNPATGAGRFDSAANGTFVYLDASSAAWPILWLDRSGKTEPLVATPGFYEAPRFSPEGSRLALNTGGLADIQIYDWKRDTTTRLTFNGQGGALPVWTPDGKHIVFRSVTPSGYALEWMRSDGGGSPQRVFESKDDLRPNSFSPDGKRLAFAQVTATSANDLWTLPIDWIDPDHPKPARAEVFLQTRFNELEPAISPDGRWIAYTSDESGRSEVYVRPFVAGGAEWGKWQISVGGRTPIWAKNRAELFYLALDNRIMSARYTAQGDSFVPEKPTVAASMQVYSPNASSWSFDVAPDGQRFAVLAPPNSVGGTTKSVHVTFLLNFFDELRRRISPDD